MPNQVKNVVAGKPLSTGGVLMGPLGTTLPVDESVALHAALKSAGYIGEDGLTETIGRDTDKVKAWGGDVVKVVQTEYSVQYKFTFIESINAEVLKAVHGDANVTITPATVSAGNKYAVKLTADQLPHKVWVFEVKDGDARIRIVVEDGQIVEVGDITYADEDVIGYEVTVEAFLGTTTQAQAVKYIDDGQKTA